MAPGRGNVKSMACMSKRKEANMSGLHGAETHMERVTVSETTGQT